MLDEIDKVGKDFHGDPASALLEVLDPEQNHAFHDNFVEVEYDLSRVMFVATANSLSTIHPALRDRMEIIEVNGYTMEEKLEIAKRHLMPKQLKETAVKTKQIKFGAGCWRPSWRTTPTRAACAPWTSALPNWSVTAPSCIAMRQKHDPHHSEG